MILLFDPMSLILPEIGYAFWTLLAFAIFWFILGKFAFKPIVSSIEARNGKIEEELLSAQKARLEFENLKADKENMEKEAREERMKMLAEAKQEAEAFRANEMQKAREDAAKMLESAKSEIETQKNAALNEVKKEVANLSISIAEKLVKEKLQANEAQDNLIKSIIANSN